MCKRLLALVGALALLLLLTATVAAEGGIDVTATAYTCERNPQNPMSAPGMCQHLANGSTDVMSAGIACPRSWLGQAFDVPGFGVLVCDDTPARETLYGLPHVDIRLPTLQAARVWGIRTITIYPMETPTYATPALVSHSRFRSGHLGLLPRCERPQRVLTIPFQTTKKAVE